MLIDPVEGLLTRCDKMPYNIPQPLWGHAQKNKERAYHSNTIDLNL